MPWKSDKYYIFGVCVCSLSNPCKMHAHYCIVVCGLAVQYFFTSSQKVVIKKKILNTKCVFWFSLQICLQHFSYKEVFTAIVSYLFVGILVKCPWFLSDLNQTWIFSANFQKIPQHQISWKSIQWEPSCSTWTDGWTNMRKLIVTFHNFVNVPNYMEDDGLLLCDTV
jgi:hypothetical protein